MIRPPPRSTLFPTRRSSDLGDKKCSMLHVGFLLQLSRVLCCTSTFSCNFRRHYVARELCLATFGGNMLHVGFVLQLSRGLIFILLIRKITFLLINTKIKKGFIRRFSPNG